MSNKLKKSEKILITGVAGFIGMHTAKKFLDLGCVVVGIDNFNEYYSVKLKKDRVREILPHKNFKFLKLDIANKKSLLNLFKKEKFDYVINLAAQPGVRYSIENPDPYVYSNIVGFLNILEGCRHYHVKHLVYASSSSIYGANKKVPYSVKDPVDHPISLYAATKRANELMAHTYSHLYGLPTTGLRFFTVYGPWNRPDMAVSLFADALIKQKPIQVFNNGEMFRDFTYIDDIVEGISKILFKIPKPNPKADLKNPGISNVPFRIYNIGHNQPVKLTDFIEILENEFSRKAIKKMLPIQPGDVVSTHADINDLKAEIGFVPKTSLKDGISSFVSWYKKYYKIK